jgi:hypothetical protein
MTRDGLAPNDTTVAAIGGVKGTSAVVQKLLPQINPKTRTKLVSKSANF